MVGEIMKKALVLAGGIAQVALIDELKDRGYRTLLADMNPHCVAAPYADEFYKVSAMDTDALAELAVKENVDLVLTACADQILVAEVKVCEKLGLPTYLDLKTTELVSDKSYMKDVFTRHSIPTSRYTTVTEYDEKRFEGLSFPLVVKPVDAYSARGVRRCNDQAQLQEYLSKAIEISRSKKAIVEEFVEGDELTVEAFVIDGKATVLCIGAKNKLKDGKFVGCGSLYPADISAELEAEIKETTQKIAEAFELKNCPINMQMITDGRHAYVLEFCARTGGFVKYEITRIMSGFDPISAIVDLHEGKRPVLNGIRPENRYLLTCYLYCSEGTLDRYEGFKEAKDEGLISRYYLVREKGHQFKGIESNGDRAAGFIIQDDDYDELLNKYAKALKRLRVLDKDGKDLVRYDLM